jgi:flagellar protein FliL
MAENAAPETEPKKPKSKMLLFIIAPVVLLLLGGGGFFAYRYFKAPKPAEDAAKKEEHAKEAEGKAGKHEMKSTLNLEPFLVNLADTENPRFLKVTFRLGLDDAKLGEELSGDAVALAAARDSIISLLSSKTAEQILSAEGKNQLREEVKTKVNSVLPKGKVGEVYIVDFVVQM